MITAGNIIDAQISQKKDKNTHKHYILFIDFSKAFDLVKHHILLQKLIKFKTLNPNTIQIIKLLLSSYRASIDGASIININ